MTTQTLWCAAAGVWGGAAAFLVVSVHGLVQGLRGRSRPSEPVELECAPGDDAARRVRPRG